MMRDGEILKTLQRIYEETGKASERFRNHRDRDELLTVLKEVAELLNELVGILELEKILLI